MKKRLYIFGSIVLIIFTIYTCNSLNNAYKKHIFASDPDTKVIQNKLKEIFKVLDEKLDPNGKKDFINTKEEKLIGKYHFGLGLSIRNNMLYSDKKLQDMFLRIGIKSIDDMSGIIINSYYRYLKNIDLDLYGQVQKYKEIYRN